MTSNFGFSVLALVVLAGCSSATTVGGASPGETCAERKGTYIVTFSERSGNCGPISEQVFTLASQANSFDPKCSGTQRTSTDNCVVEIDTLCPVSAAVSLKQVGKATWSEDGSSGEALLQIALIGADGLATCSSTYDAKYARVN